VPLTGRFWLVPLRAGGVCRPVAGGLVTQTSVTQRQDAAIHDIVHVRMQRWVAQRGYAKRSEAFRDIVRAEMDRNKVTAKPKGQCVACLSYVFNHHEHCIETVMLRGSIAAVQAFADALCAERGVHHGKLNLMRADCR